MKTELPAGMMEEIEEAAQVAAENFPDDDTMLTIPQASVAIGINNVTCYGWVKEHAIPSEKIGGRVYIRESVVDMVKELRDQHGRDWKSFATWGAVENEAPEEEVHEVVELSDDQWAHFWNLMRHARRLYDKGNASGAADVVFAACDEFYVL